MFGTVVFVPKRCIQKYRILGLYLSFSGYRLFSKLEVTFFRLKLPYIFTLDWEKYIYIRIGRGTSKNVNSSKLEMT